MTTREDLGRLWMLDVDANGAVTIRAKGVIQLHPQGLPVFSTDTREEAEQLRVLHCRLARDGSGVYFLNEPLNGVGDLPRVSDLFRESRARLRFDVEAQVEEQGR